MYLKRKSGKGKNLRYDSAVIGSVILKFKNLLDKHNDIELIIVEKCQILNIRTVQR